MPYFVYFIYLIAFSIIILKAPYFKRNGLSPGFLLFIFYLLILFGIGNILVHEKIFNYNDGVMYLDRGEGIFNSIYENPRYFLELVFGPIKKDMDTPAYLQPYIEDIVRNTGREFSIIRVTALMYPLSLGNFYIHTLIVTFIVLIAMYKLYRVFCHFSPEKRTLFLLAIFFIPSFIFWVTGATKDTLIFICTCFILEEIIFLFKRKINIYRILLNIGLLYLFVGTRPFFFLIFAATMIAFLLSLKLKKRVLVVYISVITSLLLGAGLIDYKSENIDIIDKLADRHLLYSNESQVEPGIENNLKSIVSYVPSAFLNAFYRPFVSECKYILQWITLIESRIYLLFIVFLCFFIERSKKLPISWFGIIYSFLVMIIIGLMVFNIGQISRYKSTLLPFFLLGLFSMVDKDRFGRLVLRIGIIRRLKFLLHSKVFT